MKAWLKWSAGLAVALLATNATAADHGDGPGVMASPEADITDVYSWMNGGKLVLIMNVNAGAFSDSVQYAFHVARQADGLTALTSTPSAWTDVICTFGATGADSTTCYWGDATTFDMVSGDASDPSNPLAAGSMFRVTAGEYQDPFFFYLTGFRDARTTVNNVVGAGLLTFNTLGCPDNMDTSPNMAPYGTDQYAVIVQNLLTGTKDFDYNDTTPSNNFDGLTVSSIIVELEPSVIPGTDPYLQVWASTHQGS